MDSQHLLFGILLGGLLGFSGQVIRVVVGMKKMYDKTRDTTTPSAPEQKSFETQRLVISLIIGFVAGVLAALALNIKDVPNVTKEMASGIIAAGYAGADFIEGFMRKADPTPVIDRPVA
jgi:putative chitinase